MMRSWFRSKWFSCGFLGSGWLLILFDFRCFKLKQEKEAGVADSDQATQTTTQGAQGTRERAFSVSRLSESLTDALNDDDLDLELDVEMPTPAPTREEPAGKRARRHSPVSSSSTQKTAAPKDAPLRPTLLAPFERPNSPSVSKTTSTNAWFAETYQHTPSRQGSDDVPAPKSQEKRGHNNNKSSRQPQSQTKIKTTRKPKTGSKNKTPTQQQQQPSPNTQPQSQISYAETPTFTFKFIVSYSDPHPRLASYPSDIDIDYHASADMADALPDFWPLLGTLLDEWETFAGADWSWELQKPDASNKKGKRYCVQSKLAGVPTKWRVGDEGFFACHNCAMAGRPCFTWVEDQDAKWVWQGEDDGGLGEEARGEFWCLPVHVEDRRNVVVVDKEIWTWVNDGSEEGGEEGCWDEWKELGEGDDGSPGSSSAFSSSYDDGDVDE